MGEYADMENSARFEDYIQEFDRNKSNVYELEDIEVQTVTVWNSSSKTSDPIDILKSEGNKMSKIEQALNQEPKQKIDNMEIYNAVREVPESAKKEIGGGRSKGMTSINPMWRIEKLTNLFGICGFGWKYEITKQWTEISTPNEVSAFVNVNLYIKYNGVWSEAIPGTGGSRLLTQEKTGLYTSDECYKMALTDALSVACKALGIGADVYWDKDSNKYDDDKLPQQSENQSGLTEKQINRYYAMKKQSTFTDKQMQAYFTKHFNKSEISQLTRKEYDEVCDGLQKKIDEINSDGVSA